MEYLLMHKNVPVAEMQLDDETCFILGIEKLLNPEHLPVGIGFKKGVVDRRELNAWWLSRSIPASRSGLRKALELLNISSQNTLLAKCFGLSLSDQYWVCPKNSDLTWSKVNFFENPFSDDVGTALFGNSPDSKEISLISPNNTSDGWLKKKWIIKDSKRCLVKGGSNPFQQEPFNELIAAEVMRRLGIYHTEYLLVWEDNLPYSVCEDFITAQTELVNANSINKALKRENHVSSYEYFLNCCETLGIPNAKKSIDDMLMTDYIIANTDRHFGNFGAVRNAETLEWIGIAPMFDCGTSMWHDRLVSKATIGTDAESKPFRSHHSEQIKLVNTAAYDLSVLDGMSDFCREVYSQSENIGEQRTAILCEMIDKRIEMAEKMGQSQQPKLSM